MNVAVIVCCKVIGKQILTVITIPWTTYDIDTGVFCVSRTKFIGKQSRSSADRSADVVITIFCGNSSVCKIFCLHHAASGICAAQSFYRKFSRFLAHSSGDNTIGLGKLFRFQIFMNSTHNIFPKRFRIGG